MRYLLTLLATPIVYVGYLIARKTWRYTSGDLTEGLLIGKQAYLQEPGYLTAFYAHGFLSVLVLGAGLMQFWPYLYRSRPAWHRWAGRFYAMAVLLICAPAGLWISRYANGGLPAEIAFSLQAVLWWGCTWLAWYYARKRDWNNHLLFMLRSYALALGAVSLRILAWLLPLVVEAYPTETYITNAWLSWVGNLLILEILLALGLKAYLLKRFFRSSQSVDTQ